MSVSPRRRRMARRWNRNLKKNRSKIRNASSVFFLALGLVCLYFFGKEVYSRFTATSKMNSLQQYVLIEEDDTLPIVELGEYESEEEEEEEIVVPEEDDDYVEVMLTSISVDFESLWEINTDIYAWIYIPGTNVNYPILQSAEGVDDEYYLNYNLDGTEGKPGCIFTKKYNSRDFTDRNTIIYGHNIRTGTMFRTLHYFEDEKFFEQHSYFYIVTPEDGTIIYKIFAAYKTDNNDIMVAHGYFESEQIFAEYLQTIYSMGSYSSVYVRSDVAVTSSDSIVTLSTCTGDSDYRYVVQGVRIN